MLFQKLQFSIYERLIKIRFLVMLVILSICAWTFLSVFMKLRHNQFSNLYFEQCISKYRLLNSIEDGYIMPLDTIIKIVPVYEGLEDSCSIVNKQNATIPSIKGIHLFRDISLQFLPQQVKQKHLLNQVQLTINMNNITPSTVYNHFGVYEILIAKIQQVVDIHNVDGLYVRDLLYGHETIEIKNKNYKNFLKRGANKFINIWIAFLRVFCTSVFAGLISVTLLTMLIRAMILIGQVLFRTLKLQILFRYFPFLNQYLVGLRQTRKTYIVKYILLAYFLTSCIVFFGLLYFASFIVKNTLIGLYYDSGNSIALLQVSIIQFISLIINRTRTSIKHSPSIILGIYITCQLLSSMNSYQLPLFYLQLAFQICLIYLFVQLLTVENTVFKSQQFNRPQKQHPRAMYFPNFNIGWHSIIPPLWTYFVPPHDRSFFNSSQLCYINGQYERLYCILMGLPYNEDEAEPLAQIQQNQNNQVEMDIVQNLL